jgi:SET domain-containing protein
VNDNPRGGLILLEAGPKGRGVFANRDFKKGQVVLEFAGPLLREEDIEDFTYTIQVDIGLYVGSSGGIDDFVNHCCEPTCLLRSEPPRLQMVAARDIAKGEEIHFDYATCISCGPTLALCFCGAQTCRGTVGTFWDLDAKTRARFQRRGAIPEYVLLTRPQRERVPSALSRRRG